MSPRSMWSFTATAPQVITQHEVRAPSKTDLVDGQVLLRVLVGGICGSDLPFFRGKGMPDGIGRDSRETIEPPVGSPLHEVVGEIVASKDQSLPAGAVVVGWASGMNAMAEYVVVDGCDVIDFSASLPPSLAIMLQPLACVIFAVDALRDLPSSRVAVIGQGSIGILFSHVIKTRGAEYVIGVDRVDRSDVADQFGVDEPVWLASDRWAAGLAKGERPQIVVEAVGHQVSTLTDATTAIADGGQIYYFGIPDDPIYPFPMWRFLRSCACLYAGYTPPPARRDCLRRAEQHLLAHPEIAGPYISRTFKFTQSQDAFLAANTPKRGQLKVTLEV